MPKRRTIPRNIIKKRANKKAKQGNTTDYLIELALDSVLDTDLPELRSFFLLEHELTNSHYLLKHQMDAVIGCYGTFNIELLKTIPLIQLSEEEYRQKKELASDNTFRSAFTRMLLKTDIPDDPTLDQNEKFSLALLKTLFKQRVDEILDAIKENTPCLGVHPDNPRLTLHNLRYLLDENKENIPPCS